MTIRDWSNFIGGRTALITGSGAGVGRAIAIQMARAGAEIWVNDLDRDGAGSVCAAMLDTTGPLDIVVNNAGTGVRSFSEGVRLVPFVETGPDDWDPVIRVNL